MCLYIGNKKPFVAKSDIVVYKYVKKSDDGEYVTPYRNYPVKLNSTLVGSENGEDVVDEACGKYVVGGGAIHSCTSSDVKDGGYICLKAIIKEGTEFWIQDDLNQVASRSLYITDEVVAEEQHTDITELCRQILEDAPSNKDGVKVGDVVLSDKTFVSPLGEFDKGKAIGYVAGFNPKDDTPIVVALEGKQLPFLTEYDYPNTCHSDIRSEMDVENDFDGYKHTYDIAGADDYKSDMFKAIDYCIDYETEGTSRGDWYLGATGEMIMLAGNLAIVNASIMLAGVGKEIDFVWTWTSSQRLDGQDPFSWGVNLGNGGCGCNWYDRDDKAQVRPFFAFIKQA